MRLCNTVTLAFWNYEGRIADVIFSVCQELFCKLHVIALRIAHLWFSRITDVNEYYQCM